MVDFSSYKVPIYPGINDAPIAPTLTEGQNISYMNSRFNTFVDAMQTAITDLRTDLDNLQEQFNNLSSNAPDSFTFNIPDDSFFFIGEISKTGTIIEAILSGVSDASAITFSINGNTLITDTITDNSGYFAITFDAGSSSVSQYDTLEGISTEFPISSVILDVFVE